MGLFSSMNRRFPLQQLADMNDSDCSDLAVRQIVGRRFVKWLNGADQADPFSPQTHFLRIFSHFLTQ